jgi:hypothetical protein
MTVLIETLRQSPADQSCHVVPSRFVQGKRMCRLKVTFDRLSPGSAFRTSSSFWRAKEQSTMTLDPSDLKLRIDEAFGGVPYPGDEHIVACDCWECQDVKSALKGLDWRDVDVSFKRLGHLWEALTLLSPEGFRFYLPACMLISVMNFDRADIIPNCVVSRLTPLYASDIDRLSRERDREMMREYYRSGEAERRFLKRVSGLSEAQCKVIRQFLEYMRDAYRTEFVSQEAETALERYWCQFSLP